MTNSINFKDLYSVSLKTTYSIEIGGKSFEAGETVAMFDDIQIANFQEMKDLVSANGGFDNRSRIIWETTKEIKISFTQGIFSKLQLALMSNSNILEKGQGEVILLDAREILESDQDGKVEVNQKPEGKIFVYDAATGEKVKDWTREEKIFCFADKYKEYIIDYQYVYPNKKIVLEVGRPLISGYLSLVGKMKVKDDITGKVTTGIIKIPKLKLMSDLSIRLGSDSIPQVARLDAIAIPEGARGQSKVMEIIFLEDDIDADI